jgi:transposase InsO family protein
MIGRLSVQYPVKDCCEALGVSRSGYYQWKGVKPGARAQQEAKLSQEMRKLFEQNRGRYGSPRLTRALREEGHSVGENRVARLMRVNKLVARKKRAFRPRTTVAAKAVVPNQIGHLEPDRPDQIWVSDITYVATVQGWLFLAVILDLFSRRVVGWKISESLEAGLVCSALENALMLRQPRAGLLFHSDRGCQYSSQAVQKPLEVIGAVRSMSGVGNCYDNAKAEAFFSTLKTECFPAANVFSSKLEARRTIFEYIETYYNNCRLHSALGYQSPRQYEAAYQKEKKTTFSAEKVTVTLSAGGGVKVKESKRNKWRAARREAPFMPDCDLDRSATFCLQPTQN